MMVSKKEHVEQFIRDLRSADYYCRRIMELNLTLEMLECLLQGVKSPSIHEVFIKNAGLPYQNNKLALIEKETYITDQRQKYVERIIECERIERINDPIDKCLVIDLFVLKHKYTALEKKYTYTRSAIHKKAMKILNEICD